MARQGRIRAAHPRGGGGRRALPALQRSGTVPGRRHPGPARNAGAARTVGVRLRAPRRRAPGRPLLARPRGLQRGRGGGMGGADDEPHGYGHALRRAGAVRRVGGLHGEDAHRRHPLQPDGERQRRRRTRRHDRDRAEHVPFERHPACASHPLRAVILVWCLSIRSAVGEMGPGSADGNTECMEIARRR